MEISLAFPCYNEEDNIEKLVLKTVVILEDISDNYEIIIVNDGSVDNTGIIAEKLSRNNKNIKVIHHKQNRGYGAAVASGLKAGKYDIIGFIDGDGQLDPAEIEKFLPYFHRSDIVVGYRIKRKDPFYRLVNSMLFGMLIRLLYGLKIRDLNCAFKFFTKEVIDCIDIGSNGALINAEILIKAKKKGYTFTEVGVHHYSRLQGKQTGADLRVIIKAFTELYYLHKKLR